MSVVNRVVLLHLVKNVLLLISAHLLEEAGISNVILSSGSKLVAYFLQILPKAKFLEKQKRYFRLVAGQFAELIS